MTILPAVTLASCVISCTAMISMFFVVHHFRRKMRERDKKQSLLEKELRCASERFEKIFNANTDAILILRLDDGVFLEVNKFGAAMFGWRRKQLLEMTDEKAGIWGSQEDKQRICHDVGIYGAAWDMECLMKTMNGDLFPCSVSASTLDLAGEKCQVLVVRDVSEKHKLRKERDELNAKLMQSSRLATIGTLASGVAHEVNNPLAIMKTALSFVRRKAVEGALAAEVIDFIDEMGSATDRIKKIVQNLRLFAKDEGKSNQPFSVHDAINSTIKFMTGDLNDSAIEVQLDLSAGIDLALGNPDRFIQVLTNVFINARDAMLEYEDRPAGLARKLVVRTENADGGIAVYAGDNGTGMSPDVADKIFDPFFSTKPPGKGTGMGLPISQSFMNDMRGTISIHSTGKDGTVMRLWLPVSMSPSST